jgi:hypothetical protein
MPALLTMVVGSLILCGCVGPTVYSRLDAQLLRGDCPAAIATIDGSRSTYGDNAQLLYLLDAAMVRLQCGDSDAAQRHFRDAEALAERLWTESVARHALSLITSDWALPYAGEDYERVMIHLMSAMGYLAAGQPEKALVEFRRLDSLLALYNARYEKKNVYREDAFARYLSGIVREADGDLDGAFIDYRRAARVYASDYRAYGIDLPAILTQDLLRVASAVGRTDDIDKLALVDEDLTASAAGDRADTGKVVFVAFVGHAPHKVQNMLLIPTPDGPVGVAFPRMVVSAPGCAQGSLYLNGGGRTFHADLELVEDINRIALKNLDDRMGRTLARAVARGAAKQAAIHGISRSGGDGDDQRTIAAMLNMSNVLFVERADTRSWRTLPGRIYMTRLFVPAGDYQVVLKACDGVPPSLGTLAVQPGSTHFLFRDHRYPAQHSMESKK